MKLQVTIEFTGEEDLQTAIDDAVRDLLREEIHLLLTELDVIQNPSKTLPDQ